MSLRDEIAEIIEKSVIKTFNRFQGNWAEETTDRVLDLSVEITEICTSDNRKEDCAEHMGREECTLQAPKDGIRRCKGALKRIVPLQEVIEGRARRV